jgi:hypothetical protein
MGDTMQLVVAPNGSVRCVYGEALDLSALGSLNIARASHVEPDAHGQWLVDLSPLGGPTLGPFEKRSLALVAELRWLDMHWLPACS